MAITTKISELPAKGSTLGSGDLVPIAEVDAGSPTGYTTKYVTGAEVGGGGTNTIYTADDTIASTRTVTIANRLIWDDGAISRENVNGRNIVEVIRESDIPSPLTANTTYVIRGEIQFTSAKLVSNEGCEIIGLDRNEDCIDWNGTGSFLRVTDVNFGIANLKFKSSSIDNSILRATNISAGAYNEGRLKVLRVQNVQFRGTYNVMDVGGFDLVDINNCLFFYIKATTFGCRFEDVSKLQITSCEFIRWFDETTIPTPSGFSTVSMIELQANGIIGFGAININGCVIHPQQNQNGIDISTSSTTGFGTISSNTFVDSNLLGEVFLPVQGTLPDYGNTATQNYDVFTNQGLLNSRAGILSTMQNNTGAGSETVISTINTPVQIETNNNNVQQDRVRWSGASDGTFTYLAKKQIFVSIHASISYEKIGGGSGQNYTFYVYKNNVQVAFSALQTNAVNDIANITMSFATLIENTNQLKFYVENNSGTSNIAIRDWSIVIRE